MHNTVLLTVNREKRKVQKKKKNPRGLFFLPFLAPLLLSSHPWIYFGPAGGKVEVVTSETEPSQVSPHGIPA